jgi:hypothetical protein
MCIRTFHEEAEMYNQYAFISAQCREWIERFDNGEAFEVARRDCPGQWVVVHDLRPLEFIAFMLGIHRPYRPVQVIQWDETAQVYISRPYRMLTQRVRRTLPMGPWAWWKSFLSRQTPTIREWWWCLERGIARTSEQFDAWLRGLGRRHRHDRA